MFTNKLWKGYLNLASRFCSNLSSNLNSSAATSSALPIVHIKASFNNTIVTVTDNSGRTLAWASGGSEGFRNARKGTTFAAQSAGLSAAKKALALGVEQVVVKLKGIGPGRQSAIKGLEAGGMKITVLQDVTPVPHNGCRPRKARRL